ncbi:ATP-binding protein [Weeksellaceae bacterium TAE3-ERU29]|nr:ATP-binding protein [Weeksellaceae bacterium TAE3-ERU29]
MIQSFSVQNFASIKDRITLNFEASKDEKLSDYYIISPDGKTRLLKLAMIYGANASGKTNVLESLEFLVRTLIFPLESKNDFFEFEPFSFQENPKHIPTYFELIFWVGKRKYFYEIALSNLAIHQEELYASNGRKYKVFSRKNDLDKKLSKIEFGSKISITATDKEVLEANTLWNNSVFGGYEKTNVYIEELKECMEWLTSYTRPLIYPKSDLKDFAINTLQDNKAQKEIMLQLLNKADFCIDDIEVKSFEFDITDEFLEQYPEPMRKVLNSVKPDNNKIRKKEVLFYHKINGKHYPLVYSQESEGTRRYFELSGLFAGIIQNPTFTLIDEIESSLHPDLLQHFLLLFLENSNQSQILCTTHFREFLQEKELYRDDVIWFTEKNKEGATELYSLDDFGSEVIRDTSSVFNAYKIGKLGATPKLSDIYLNTNEE